MIEIKGQSCIAGNWITPPGENFQSFNPYSKETMYGFASCGSNEIEQATRAADHAFQTYRKLDGKTIGVFLNTIADEIEALGDQLLEVCDSETALGLIRLTGERGRTSGQLRAFAELASKGEWVQASIDTALPDRAPVPKPDLRRMMKAIGPVAIFGASNFPFAFSTLGGDTASALAAGNPVIVKGHPAHPATSELFAHAINRAIDKCGVPAGVFSLLQGVGNELGAGLVKHPLIQAVGFTGSEGGGRALMDIAAARLQPIPVFAEMGSINPLFVGPKTLQAQAESIAAGLSGSVCMGTGQFCTSPGIVVSVASEVFETALKTSLSAAPRGYLLNPQIAASLQTGLENLNNHPQLEWLNREDFEAGSMTPPNAVFKTSGKDFLADKTLSEEVFGPVTLYVVCKNEAQIMEVAENLNGNLTASVHADEDMDLAEKLFNELEQKVGRVIYNGYPTGVEVCPSQQHGGPYPASSVSTSTSVGVGAIVRFARFVAYQGTPDTLLPDALKNENPLGIYRLVNGELTTAGI
ncbi:MAG: aldehyde dehydrogenase (NADP(+)) [Xanthomonadales bacterium]|nr:aldehyde dehydrogenase (NADP(+)) [Xanthomonadales bacterium]